jgi:hypothetical protein
LARSCACSAANRTAWKCTASKARATCPISSLVRTGTGSTTSGVEPSRTPATAAGSRVSATSRAARRSVRSGTRIERAITKLTTTPNASAKSRITAVHPAVARAASRSVAAVAASWSRSPCSALIIGSMTAAERVTHSTGGVAGGCPAAPRSTTN